MIKADLQLNNLEKEVLKHFLIKNQINEDFFGANFELFEVTKREMTGVGFYTEIQTSKSFKELGLESLRWGETRATLNKDQDVGFLIYIDNYKLNTIEGYTYGDTSWPEQISSFIVRDLNKDEF